MTAKLDDIDPQAWLAEVLTRIASTPQGRLNELLLGNGRTALFNLRPDRDTPQRDYLAAFTGGLPH